MLDILNPTKRKLLYGVISAVAVIVVTLGFAPKVTVDNWVEVIAQALGFLALVLASIKAKRVDYTAIYGGAAALVAALTAAGVLNDGTASQIYDVMAQVAIALPLLVAFVRTDPETTTGEPLSEYVPQHAAVVLNAADAPPVDEAGAVNVSPLILVAAVVVIVAGLIFIVQALT